MNPEKYFNIEAKTLFTSAKNKDDLLRDIAKQAKMSATLADIDVDTIYENLKEREAIGSTGFGEKIAIPHCTLHHINHFVIGVLISKEGLDFKSLDGSPTHVFMYIIAPAKRRNDHIRILSEISKVLRVPAQVEDLLSKTSVKDFFETFKSYGTWKDEEDLPHEYTQMNVHVQDAGTFEKILEYFTEIPDCHLSVLEANDASKYLYSLPLFSQFINEDRKKFHRLIVAVLNAVYVNNSIREINKIAKASKDPSKVMLTTQVLTYYSGSINI
jgi:mannitol/fructose-specific phosphotransferase system IIA component (Ntr-type)